MNKETLRRNKLFALLEMEKDYKPASYFSSLLNVSEKTLYTDINYLNQTFFRYKLFIEKTPRKGILLQGCTDQIELYKLNNQLFKTEEKYSPKNRQRTIVRKMLIEDEKVNYEILEKQLYISNTVLRNDLAAIKKFFSNRNVEFIFESPEFYVQGFEKDIQNSYKSYEIESFKKNGLFTLDEYYKEVEKIFIAPIVDIAQRIVITYTSQTKKVIGQSYITSLFFALCTLFTRAKNNHHFIKKVEDFAFQNIEKMETYMIALNISLSVNNELGIMLIDRDIEFLSELLLAHGIEPTVNRELLDDLYEKSVREIVEKMSKTLKVDLTDDERLHEALLSHVIPMIYRLKNGFTVKNPLLDSIKRQYMVMFTLTWYVAVVFEDLFNVILNDDEVSFLTIHFQVAFDKKIKPKNILIVCPKGLATTELVYSQVKDILPATDHIEVVTVEQVLDNDVSDVEFIISIVEKEKFANVDKKVFYVSPLITQQELNEISNYYGSINEQLRALRNIEKSNLVELTNYFRDDFLFWQYEFTNKEEVLDFMIDHYEKADLVTSGFRESIYAREEEGTTSMYTGVAMPHASSSTVKKTLLSIMTLKKSIKWKENDVNTIIMIALADEDVDEVRNIISKLYDLIETKDKTNTLLRIKSTEQFAILLQEVNGKEN
ncbi:MAG: BglG family transcription antiterminator [Erysipelotrichaceae bacterium]